MKLPILALLLALAGCGTIPTQHVYVLSPPLDQNAQVANFQGKPYVWVRPVLLPDYLDTTDILRRRGPSELTASPTGRWGERLSAGLTRALAAALATALPEDEVTLAAPTGDAARRILVTVEAFDNDPDGRTQLTAGWTIVGPAGQILGAGRGNFVAAASMASGPPDDAALVAAMENAVVQLATRIAAAIGGRQAR